MFRNPMDVLYQFPVRKSKSQKQAFRDAVQTYVESLGYSVSVEQGSFGVRNIVIGNPDSAKYLVTAHYDTCARMILPNMVTPCNALVFWSYQILVVLMILLPSLAVGLLLGFLPEVKGFAGTAALALYWFLLLLMIFGPANTSNANDNTSGVVTLLEIARTMPENQRHKVCFVLFDLEEAGLLGSAAYVKAHKKTCKNQTVLNMDCVGDGDHILLMPSKKLKRNTTSLAPIYKACGYFGTKSILVKDKGYCYYPSDQTNFPNGVAIAAFHKKKGIGYYYGRIHTIRDTMLDETNVNLLRAAITTVITGDAAQ